jgi:hypothetical protein
MRIPHAILAMVLILGTGCQKPGPVTVDPDVILNSTLEVTTIGTPDTNLTVSGVDSSGIIPADGVNYAGFLLLNNIRYETGAGGFKTEVFSSVYFVDRNRPLLWNGKPVGYFGIDVAPGVLQFVTINSLPLLRVPYRLRVPGASVADSAFGYTFVRELSAMYQPNTTYTWNVPALNTMSGFAPQIKSPDELRVSSPAGGSVLQREKGLVLRWTGKGDIDIVISLYFPGTRKTRPLLKIHPKVNTGGAVLDQRILQLLPRDRYFIVTFILARREERQLPGLFNGRILIQAAAVHNSYIELL